MDTEGRVHTTSEITQALNKIAYQELILGLARIDATTLSHLYTDRKLYKLSMKSYYSLAKLAYLAKLLVCNRN